VRPYLHIPSRVQTTVSFDLASLARYTRHVRYPKVQEESLIGTYPAVAKAGGGYVWDAVLGIAYGAIQSWGHPM